MDATAPVPGEANLASAERESADLRWLNRALCAPLDEDQDANLLAEQAACIEQLRDENAAPTPPSQMKMPHGSWRA